MSNSEVLTCFNVQNAKNEKNAGYILKQEQPHHQVMNVMIYLPHYPQNGPLNMN